MALTSDQVKGRIKNLAKENNSDARILIRIYMMERFLERVSLSRYSENFVIKGGVLVTSMVGIAMRSTMDIDTTLRNIDLTEDDAHRIVEDIISLDVADNVSFEITGVEHIMDDMEYPGIRITLNSKLERTCTPIKVDISTGDAITPRAIEYNYKLMLENRVIKLWSYNLETILAEKLQTILARGILNTRMRDFYDIHVLLSAYDSSVDADVFCRAFEATCQKRSTVGLKDNAAVIKEKLLSDNGIQLLWESYRKRYSYAADITYSDVISSVEKLLRLLFA